MSHLNVIKRLNLSEQKCLKSYMSNNFFFVGQHVLILKFILSFLSNYFTCSVTLFTSIVTSKHYKKQV